MANDVFDGSLKGLSMIEVDLGAVARAHDMLPFDGVIEVTHDERFTGGKLAGTSVAGIRLLLNEYGVK